METDIEVGDAREVDRVSGRLEGTLTARGIEVLEKAGIQIAEVITDASKTFISYFGKYDYHIPYSIIDNHYIGLLPSYLANLTLQQVLLGTLISLVFIGGLYMRSEGHR